MLRTNLMVVRGDTLVLDLQIFDEDYRPFNLANASVFFTVKEDMDQPDNQAIIQIKQTNHMDPTNGKTVIEVPYTLTERLNPKRLYWFDIQVVKNNRVFTVVFGTLRALPSVTSRVE